MKCEEEEREKIESDDDDDVVSRISTMLTNTYVRKSNGQLTAIFSPLFL